MRIAILTFHRAFNCGAMLQAWALKTELERQGHVVEFPDCNRVGDIPRWRFSACNWRTRAGLKQALKEVRYNLYSLGSEDLSRTGFRDFRRQNLPERHCAPSDFPRFYDAVVIGSDQVWTSSITGPWTSLFLGEDIPDGMPMVAYSASAGDRLPEGEDLCRLQRACGRLSGVSVRERALGAAIGGSVSSACDPSLLMSADDYNSIAVAPPETRPFLYAYTSVPSAFLMQTVREASARLALASVVTPIGQFSRFRAPSGLTYAVSPGKMVGYQRAASAVVTDSFHGTALALVHNRPFVSLQGTPDRKTRIGDLLDRLGLANRLVTPETPMSTVTRLLTEPLPDSAGRTLVSFADESRRWLVKTLGASGKRGV